jgi:hypothetical protein
MHLVGARGLTQVRTTLGRAIFRLARRMLVLAAVSYPTKNLTDQGLQLGYVIHGCTSAPSFIISFTQRMRFEPKYSGVDKLAVLIARLSIVREQFDQASSTLDELIRTCRSLRKGFEKLGNEDFADAKTGLTNGNHNMVHTGCDAEIMPQIFDHDLTLLDWQTHMGLAMDLEEEIFLTGLQRQHCDSTILPSMFSTTRFILASAMTLRVDALMDLIRQANTPRGWIMIVLHFVGPLRYAGLWLQKEQSLRNDTIEDQMSAPVQGLGSSSLDYPGAQLAWVAATLTHISERVCDCYAREAVLLLTR